MILVVIKGAIIVVVKAYPYLDKCNDLYHMYIAAAPPGMNP